MKRSLSLALLLGLALLQGCSGDGFELPPAAPPSYPYVRLAPTPPPESAYEEPPQNPDPLHQIWRRGYWVYDGSSFLWTQGVFIEKPDPTAAWSPDRWDRRTFGWAFVPGHWQ